MTRVLLATAALVAAVAVWIVVSLPARALVLDASWSDGTVPGILHIHTSRSDGLSSPEVVAAAAANSGLAFIVFTDHGDGTRQPDAPIYRSGVLCLDAVEISTTGGHYVAIGLGAAPYPLGGEPRDVVEDVERLGGFGIAAHPDSPKAELAWRDWAPAIDGLEILNPDTGWREHLHAGALARFRLLGAIATYPWRRAETIGGLLSASANAKAEWDRLTARRPVVGIGGVDAHSNVALFDAEPGDSRFSLPIPGYEASFRTMSVHVTPSGPFTGDAAVDAARLIAGIRQGRLHTVVDAWATPARFSVTARANNTTVGEGGTMAPGPDLRLQVRHNGADGFVTTVWSGGAPVGSPRPERELSIPLPSTPGAYRVEVIDPRHPAGPAWITSNPIYVRAAMVEPAAVGEAPKAAAAAAERLDLFDGRTTAGWTLEKDRSSVSAITVAPMIDGPQLRMRYGLAGGPNVGQFAGVAADPVEGAGAYNRIAFRAHSDRPMRLSVQVRADVRAAPPERWQRSIYIDDVERAYAIDFEDMSAVGVTHTPRVPRGAIRSVLFIVDTTNTKPGVSGNVWVKDPRMER